jgi:outer membrane protein OmpA-like peptidoglycan-associated protein
MMSAISKGTSLGSWLLVAMLSSGSVSAHVQTFQSSWEKSSWRVDAEPGRCALTHDIPRFGQARFEQRSGGRLVFALQADQPPVRDQSARIISEAPPWKHQTGSAPLGDFRLQQGKTPIQLPRDQALRIYAELEKGMKPVFEFADWGDGRDQVQVVLSPVRFREALPEFLTCTAGLIYLDFEPLDEKRVYFSTNSDHLSRETRRVLEKVARAYRKKRDFRIVLGGHSDARGAADYNMQLSRSRTDMVARFLRSRGVAAKAIEPRYFGENQPQVLENDKDAWARNRRVTIWLANIQS